MTELEFQEKLLKDFIRYGSIVSDSEHECEGNYYRSTKYLYEGEHYLVTRCNGKIIYFLHLIS